MSITGYPFNGVEYSADDVAESFRRVMSNGVNVYGNSDALKVESESETSVSIESGTGWISGRMFSISSEVLAVDAGSGTPRLDRVVIKMDAEVAGGFSLYIKKGTDTAPELTRNISGSIYEISVATLSVTDAGITVIDTRAEPELCGHVSFLGETPFYPAAVIPENLWMYAFFPSELSAAEIETVEENPSLMGKWNVSRAINLKKTEEKYMHFEQTQPTLTANAAPHVTTIWLSDSHTEKWNYIEFGQTTTSAGFASLPRQGSINLNLECHNIRGYGTALTTYNPIDVVNGVATYIYEGTEGTSPNYRYITITFIFDGYKLVVEQSYETPAGGGSVPGSFYDMGILCKGRVE